MYAPKGLFTRAGSNDALRGTVLGKWVRLSGFNIILNGEGFSAQTHKRIIHETSLVAGLMNYSTYCVLGYLIRTDKRTFASSSTGRLRVAVSINSRHHI